MACRPEISDIARHCGVCETWLDRVVTQGKFYKISGCVTKWKLLAPELNISQTEVKGCGVACDNTGRIYVTDSKNQNVQVFTESGILLKKIEQLGRDLGKLNEPFPHCS